MDVTAEMCWSGKCGHKLVIDIRAMRKGMHFQCTSSFCLTDRGSFCWGVFTHTLRCNVHVLVFIQNLEKMCTKIYISLQLHSCWILDVEYIESYAYMHAYMHIWVCRVICILLSCSVLLHCMSSCCPTISASIYCKNHKLLTCLCETMRGPSQPCQALVRVNINPDMRPVYLNDWAFIY